MPEVCPHQKSFCWELNQNENNTDLFEIWCDSFIKQLIYSVYCFKNNHDDADK